MNIFQRQRQLESLRKITIRSSSMLETYQVYKSIELSLTGDYDITQYGRLEKLTEESFLKESLDLRHTVQIIESCQLDNLARLQMCLVIAMNSLEEPVKRSELARTYKYKTVKGKEYVLSGGLSELPFIEREDDGSNWLFAGSNERIKRFKLIVNWLNKIKS